MRNVVISGKGLICLSEDKSPVMLPRRLLQCPLVKNVDIYSEILVYTRSLMGCIIRYVAIQIMWYKCHTSQHCTWKCENLDIYILLYGPSSALYSTHDQIHILLVSHFLLVN